MSSPTTPPVWRRAFLRALSQGAPVTMAAAYAGICRRQPYALRRKDPLFAKLWAEAQKCGRKARKSGKPLDHLTPKPRPILAIRPSRSGKTKASRPAERQWDEEKERQFLIHLSATANVEASADAVGMSRTSLYRRRLKWPAFREAWDAAKANAVDRLEFLLIDAATNFLDPPEVPVADLIPVTFDQAMRVLERADKLNRRGEPKRNGWRRKPVDMDALGEEIIRKLAVIRKHNAA